MAATSIAPSYQSKAGLTDVGQERTPAYSFVGDGGRS
jgi:hypothetical protein